MPYVSVEDAIGDYPPSAAGKGESLLFLQSPPLDELSSLGEDWFGGDSLITDREPIRQGI